MNLKNIDKSFFINLDHRKDRLQHINKNLPFSAERFPAIDAKNLELNDEIKKIFGKNLQKFTKAEIACSLSHYRLWKRLTLDKDADNYLILEDDAVFKQGFINSWNQVFSKHMPENYNLIYLGGCQPWNKPQYHKVLKPHNDYFNNIKNNNFFSKDDHFWHMTTCSYVVSKNAASLMCQYIEQSGMDKPLDFFMLRFFDQNKLFSAPNSVYHLNPLMTYQLHEEGGNIEADEKSDIRHDKEKFDTNTSEKPTPCKLYYMNKKQQEFIGLKNQWLNFFDNDRFGKHRKLFDWVNYTSSQISTPEATEDTFNCFNPFKKIAVISLYTKEISEFAVYSEKSIKDYCKKQGYSFYVYRENLDKNGSPNWSKSQALLNHIDDHDYIVWMDSDTLIFNPEKKLESIIEKAPKKFILATKDIGDHCMLNSGVLFFKSHRYTKNLIKRWRDFNGDKSSLYASGGDQEILCEILRKSDGFGFNRKIFEMNEFNTDPRLVNEDTFILHFMAYPFELKKIFMSYWCS